MRPGEAESGRSAPHRVGAVAEDAGFAWDERRREVLRDRGSALSSHPSGHRWRPSVRPGSKI